MHCFSVCTVEEEQLEAMNVKKTCQRMEMCHVCLSPSSYLLTYSLLDLTKGMGLQMILKESVDLLMLVPQTSTTKRPSN